MKSFVFMILLISSVWAHPITGAAKAVEEQALLLRQKMGPETSALTWGQKMATDDMSRLATAAQEVARVTESEDINWEDSRAFFIELQVSANRVRMSLPVSALDEEAQKVGQQMLVQVTEIDRLARAERDQNFNRQIMAARPVPSFGIGSYWASPWFAGYGLRMPFFWGHACGPYFHRHCR